MDYFKRQLNLLKIEREKDYQLYQKISETQSVAARRANGTIWYPIAIRGSEIGRGDYLIVEVERTTHQDLPHQLRYGAAAILFSNQDAERKSITGIISYQSGNRLKITLRTDELPEWASEGKLGIDLLFDDNSYDEMQNALKLADTIREKGSDNRLINILTGKQKPSFHTATAHFPCPTLNGSQQAAVNKIVSATDLAIVHGPPGTGKTTTLIQAIKRMIEQDPKPILVVAPSNTAVDLLSEKLSDQGINVLRMGNPARVSERLMSLTLDNKIAAHNHVKEMKRLKKQAAEFRDMAHKYKRNYGKAEKEQRKALFEEAKKIMKEVSEIEHYIVDDLITKTQVIAATLVGANHYTLKNTHYQCVVIDEAGQAMEPACWIPVLKAKKVVFAGDHCQLPPTVKSEEAARNGLSTTLMEKCVSLHPEAVVILEVQYRMHQIIMGYPSGIFYNNKLNAHISVANHLLFAEDAPLTFIDTAGCGFEERVDGTSTTNPEEAAFLFKHLTRLVASLTTHYCQQNFPSIAIISPYKQQIAILKEQLLLSPSLHAYEEKISVNTIDSFQGQERDIVYISMTRSNDDNKIGFLADIRRMNVAMTRARKKLVVIGDSGTLSQKDFYADFIRYAESQHAYQSAWEFIDD